MSDHFFVGIEALENKKQVERKKKKDFVIENLLCGFFAGKEQDFSHPSMSF
jgi:hypothetical protein